jgi:hypothetical protein
MLAGAVRHLRKLGAYGYANMSLLAIAICNHSKWSLFTGGVQALHELCVVPPLVQSHLQKAAADETWQLVA